MPWSVHVDFAHRLLVTVAWGTVTDQDLAEHAAAIGGHPAVSAHLRQLVDVRGVSVVAAEQELSSGTPVIAGAPDWCCAIVAVNGAARLTGRLLALPTYARGGRVRLFTRLGHAETWLGLRHGAAHLPPDPVPAPRVSDLSQNSVEAVLGA